MNLRYLKLTFRLEVADSVEDFSYFLCCKAAGWQLVQQQGVP